MNASLTSVPLFQSTKEWVRAFGALLFICFFSLAVDLYTLSNLNTQTKLQTTATVEKQVHAFTQWGDAYDKITLQTKEGLTLFTSFKLSPTPITHHEVNITVPWKEISLQEFYQGVYVSDVNVTSQFVPPSGWTRSLREYIASQHTTREMKELFGALFFDDPISLELQEKVSLFGLAAILSLSGLNVGILTVLIIFLLKPLYIFFQKRYFPYRNRQSDLMIFAIVVMVGYLVVVDFTPSFLRAVVMMVVGFVFYAKRIEIFSFASLLLVVVLILAFVPALVFSIGFWLSVAGVYFIYLFLHYWGEMASWKVYVGLTFWIYVIMLPIIHALFPLFSDLQLTSPLTSMAYDLFYPASVVLHMVGLGGLMDDMLISFLSISTNGRMVHTPLWFFYLFVVTALIAWREEVAFWLLNALGVLFFVLGVVGI